MRSAPRPLVTLTCPCGTVFSRKASQLHHVKRPVCSRACHARYALPRAGREPKLTLTCASCGDPFTRYAANLKVHPDVATCSVDCRDARRRKLSGKAPRAARAVTPVCAVVPYSEDFEDLPIGAGVMGSAA